MKFLSTIGKNTYTCFHRKVQIPKTIILKIWSLSLAVIISWLFWRRLKYIIINTTVFLREIMFQIILKYVQMKRAFFLHTMTKKCRCTFLCLPRLNPCFLSHLISCFVSHWGVPNNFRLRWLYCPVSSNVYGL